MFPLCLRVVLLSEECMTRILLVETASPQRVREKAEKILAGGIYREPEVTILCSEDPKTIHYLGEVPGVQVVPLRVESRSRILEGLSRRNFDVLHVFWTGEKKYRRMKLIALRLKAKATDVDIGDGSVFRLTWKAIIRHWQFRLAHPLPTDHWKLVPPPEAPVKPEKPEYIPEKPEYFEGQRILLVQSAEPQYVLQALEQLKDGRLLRNPRYILFCRNRPEVVKHFKNHPMIHQIRMHSEARGSWKHLRSLRKERFKTVVVFFTGDPSYWKIKCFAFLLGARHKLIFNEHNDCFFFNLGDWLALLAHRMEERSRLGVQRRWTFQARTILFLLIKVLLIPFRFIWLLLVWLRLRAAAWIASG